MSTHRKRFGTWLILSLGILGELYLGLFSLPPETPKLMGVYGAPATSIRCPHDGPIQLTLPQLGSRVSQGEVIAVVESLPLTQLKLTLSHDLKKLKATLNEQTSLEALQQPVIELDITFKRLNAAAQAEMVEAERRKTQALLKSLTQSLQRIEKSVQAGVTSEGTLAELKARQAEVRAALKPLKKGRMHLRQLAQIERESLASTIEDLAKARHELIAIMESYQAQLHNEINRIQQIISPYDSIIADWSMTDGSFCHKGEHIVLLQPISTVARLWMMSGDVHLLRKTKQFTVTPLINQIWRPQSAQTAQVTSIGHTLLPLPDPLQASSSQLVNLFSASQAPPVIRGIPVTLQLDQSWEDSIPFGTLVKATP